MAVSAIAFEGEKSKKKEVGEKKEWRLKKFSQK